MEHYVGLDVSLKQTAIRIVDQTGSIKREGVVPSDTEAIHWTIASVKAGRLQLQQRLESENRVALLSAAASAL
jgi:hypothetical protein